MARIRTIKPEFFTSEDTCAMSPLARLFFQACWCEADREGRLEWKPRTMKLRYFPADNCDIQAVADEVVAQGVVVLYRVEGKEFAEIPTFTRHQNINPRESKSVIPGPDGSVPEPVEDDQDLTRGDASNLDVPGQRGREGKGKEGNTEESLRASSGAEALDDVLGLADQIWSIAGITPEAFRASGKTDDIDAVSAWLELGAKPDEILAACRSKMPPGKEIRALWRFLKGTFPEAFDAVRSAAARPPPVRDTADRIMWRSRLNSYAASKFWPDIWGPKPGEPGCQCAADIIAELQLKQAS